MRQGRSLGAETVLRTGGKAQSPPTSLNSPLSAFKKKKQPWEPSPLPATCLDLVPLGHSAWKRKPERGRAIIPHPPPGLDTFADDFPEGVPINSSAPSDRLPSSPSPPPEAGGCRVLRAPPAAPQPGLPPPSPRDPLGLEAAEAVAPCPPPPRPGSAVGEAGREAIACLIVAVAALPLLSQRERHEWPGPAAPRRSSQTQRQRYGDGAPPAALPAGPGGRGEGQGRPRTADGAAGGGAGGARRGLAGSAAPPAPRCRGSTGEPPPGPHTPGGLPGGSPGRRGQREGGGPAPAPDPPRAPSAAPQPRWAVPPRVPCPPRVPPVSPPRRLLAPRGRALPPAPRPPGCPHGAWVPPPQHPAAPRALVSHPARPRPFFSPPAPCPTAWWASWGPSGSPNPPVCCPFAPSPYLPTQWVRVSPRCSSGIPRRGLPLCPVMPHFH